MRSEDIVIKKNRVTEYFGRNLLLITYLIVDVSDNSKLSAKIA